MKDGSLKMTDKVHYRNCYQEVLSEAAIEAVVLGAGFFRDWSGLHTSMLNSMVLKLSATALDDPSGRADAVIYGDTFVQSGGQIEQGNAVSGFMGTRLWTTSSSVDKTKIPAFVGGSFNGVFQTSGKKDGKQYDYYDIAPTNALGQVLTHVDYDPYWVYDPSGGTGGPSVSPLSEFTFEFDREGMTATVLRWKGSGAKATVPEFVFADGQDRVRDGEGEGVQRFSVTAIARGAFDGCTALRSIELGEGVREIPDYAFNELAQIEEVTCKRATIDRIGMSAFRGCNSLRAVNVRAKEIGDFAFYDVLSSFDLDLSLCETIGECSFTHCKGLGGPSGGYLYLPEIKSIGNDAFFGCQSVQDVFVGKNLVFLGYRAFQGCKIKSVHFEGRCPPAVGSADLGFRMFAFGGASIFARGYLGVEGLASGAWSRELTLEYRWQELPFALSPGWPKKTINLKLQAPVREGANAFDPASVDVRYYRIVGPKAGSGPRASVLAGWSGPENLELSPNAPRVPEQLGQTVDYGQICLGIYEPGDYRFECRYKNGRWRTCDDGMSVEVPEFKMTDEGLVSGDPISLVLRFEAVDDERSIRVKSADGRFVADGEEGVLRTVRLGAVLTSSVSGLFKWSAVLKDADDHFITEASGSVDLVAADNDITFSFDGPAIKAFGPCSGYRIDGIVFSDGVEVIALEEELSVAAFSLDDWPNESAPPLVLKCVGLDGNGGSCPVPTVDLALGQPYGELPPATRAGYAFDGWYTAATGGEKIAAEDLFQSRVDRLYAHWRRGAEDGVYQKEVGGVTWTYVVKNCQATVGGPDDAQRLAVDSGASGSLVIPAAFDNCPVTAIAPAAFKDCVQLAAVSVPASVRVIPEQAFMGCTALESVVLAEGLVEIGISAFENCPALKALTIPATVVRIGRRAFYGCRGLQRLVFPSSVREIGSEAFVGLRWFMEYEFEGLPPEVEEDTFGDGGYLSWPKKHEDVWQSLSSDGYWKNLEVRGLAASPKTKTQTVKGLEWRYTVKDGEATVEGLGIDDGQLSAIPEDTSGKVVIPSTLGGYPVTAIGYEAFYGCDRLTEIVVPNGVRTIGFEAFAGCGQVKKIVLPSSLRSIGEFAFALF